MSFAFEDDHNDKENGVTYERTGEVEDGKEIWLRHVKKITGLYDVSIVTHPAYEQTSVGMREIDEDIDAAIARQIESHEKRETEDPKKDEEAEREERELEEQAERARVMMMQRLRWQRRHNEEYFK